MGVCIHTHTHTHTLTHSHTRPGSPVSPTDTGGSSELSQVRQHFSLSDQFQNQLDFNSQIYARLNDIDADQAPAR